ncbi:Rhamnogalacturonan lyase B, N-terminal [Rhizoctonia solani]|uniref:Rhamnogalacturonan lyase B, N-terminal n=1 Tax=Rhizoctonia solani TaxID=456999 RepID=A0A8H7LZT6_9AGAM|nr:Rhamnogalacturonan lyase B, N-terminal [Rhizoctonia solani]
MRFSSLLFITGLPAALADFGVTEGSGYIDVDTGNQLVYRVDSFHVQWDITSIKYNSVECQYSKKYTQISSGLESATVTYKTSGEYITITITTNTLTQYYVAVSGQSALYIGTHITAEPSVGELRFIARLDGDKLTGSTASDARGGTAIEGSDVFIVSGQTRSKFYSSVRFIEDQVHGVTGSGVGVYMVIPGNGYETSSGGLSTGILITRVRQTKQRVSLHIYLDIHSPSDDGAQEMNSNYEQTESCCTGFFGPYTLVFTSGIAPSSSLDISFFEDLGLEGYVAPSGRGTYWGVASGGAFSISGVKSGTYTATLYKNELDVGTGSVTVSAGKTATLNLTSTESLPTLIWQIGVPTGPQPGSLPSITQRQSGGQPRPPKQALAPYTYTLPPPTMVVGQQSKSIAGNRALLPRRLRLTQEE